LLAVIKEQAKSHEAKAAFVQLERL